MRPANPFAIFCLSVLICAPFSSHALDYPSALPNNNLKEELVDQNDRLIPKYDWFSAAVDGQVYFRALEKYDFYHGVGYWTQLRTEFRPSEMFKLNIRSIFYSGSISGGYAKPTGQYHLFGFNALWPEEIAGGKVEARAMDLERQTIGQGLMIEEREMAGMWVNWTRDDHKLKLMFEGTGGLVKGDDLSNIDLQLFGGYLGGGTILWTASKQSGMLQNRKPLLYLNSAHSLGSHLSYFIEAGLRYSKISSMAGLKSEGTSGRLKYKTRLQLRNYANGFGEEFTGQIDNMYISYDQYNKRYTSAGNVFVVDDNALVYSLIADFDYELNDKWELQFKNEVGTFDYKEAQDNKFYFYRAGITYFPMLERNESLTFFVSNKVLTDSFTRPPAEDSLEDTMPLFHQHGFYGVEASFRF